MRKPDMPAHVAPAPTSQQAKPTRGRLLVFIAACTLILTVGQWSSLALWKVEEPVTLETISVADFQTTASWASLPQNVASPEWDPIYPGQSRDAVIQIGVNSDADHLRWKYNITTTVDNEFSDHVTVTAWNSATCGTNPIDLEMDQPSTGQIPGTTIKVCVRFTLNANAPSTLQGKAMSPAITVTGKQVAP